LAGPFAELRALHNAIRGITNGSRNTKPTTVVASKIPIDAKTPAPWRERGSLGVGSISNVMVELADLKSNRSARLPGGRMSLDDAE
jgi:hypothetical protein